MTTCAFYGKLMYRIAYEEFMARLLLTREAAFAIKRMYEELDGAGRRVHSQARIAKEFGVSETTVFRAVQSLGAYAKVPEQRPTAELQTEAEASLARMLALGTIQASAPIEDKLARAIEEERARLAQGDNLLNELKESK